MANDHIADDRKKVRLIDATDENIKAILEKVPYYPDEIWKFTAMTKRFPAVDAVEVCRCKDCKHGIPTSDGGYRCDHVDEYYAWGYRTKEDDFCSYGERRTE